MITAFTTRFCRALRERGVLATPAESIEAMRTLATVDVADRDDVFFALRAVLPARQEDLATFDELFDRWWSAEEEEGKSLRNQHSREPRNPAVRSPTDEPRAAPAATALTRWASARDAISTDAPLSIPMPSGNETIGTKDFSGYTAEDLAAIEQVAARIARRLRARPSRRWIHARRGRRLDLRRLTRLSIKTGGDPAELAYRRRKLRRTKLAVLCDVSGSMDLYSRFLMQFLFALQGAFARVETFAFSTRLARVTDSLARESYREALDALVSTPGWSGGTKIGESLGSFLIEWPRLLDRRTVVIVLSDGWDTGDPDRLVSALRLIRRRSGRLVWLNPLLGDSAYQPLTRGMQAALPHIDVFAPVHNLASLEALVGHLSL